MLLNTLNQTLTFEDTNGTIQPAAGVSVKLHRCGATVRSTVTHAAGASKVIDVEGLNTIKVDDVLYHDINTGVTMTVTGVDYSNRRVTVTLNTGATFTAGERLMVSDSTVYVWADEHKATAAVDNNLTTDSDGLLSAYTTLQQCDMLVTAGGTYSADWILQDVQIPTTRVYTPAYFGAIGVGDEIAILQQAVDRLNSYGIKKLYLDRFYTHSESLDLPVGFVLEGFSESGTGLIFTGTTDYAITTTGTGVSLRNFTLLDAGGGVFPQVYVTQQQFTMDQMSMSGAEVALTSTLAAASMHVRYSTINAAQAGVTISGDNSRIEGTSITVTDASAIALHYVPSGADVNKAYIGGQTILTAANTNGVALRAQGSASYKVELTIAGVSVGAGDIDLDYTELQVLGLSAATSDLLVDTTTATQMAGVINNDVVLKDSNGTPADTPATNVYPVRWDPDTGKLWAWDGTQWLGSTIGAPAAELEEASLYVSTPAASVIATGGLFQKASGTTTVASETSNMDATTGDNRIQYTGATGKKFLVTAAITLTASPTPNEDASIRLYRYDDSSAIGSTITSTEIQRYLSATAGQKSALAVQGIMSLDTNDYVEVHLTRPTGGGGETITIEKMHFAAIEIGDA